MSYVHIHGHEYGDDTDFDQTEAFYQSTARHSSTSKRGPFDQILSYYVSKKKTEFLKKIFF